MQSDFVIKIQNNFSNAAETYDNNNDIQKISAKNLSQLIATTLNFTPKNILDIGCGTGLLTQELYRYFPKATYHLMDISDEMLAISKKKFMQFSYRYILLNGADASVIKYVMQQNIDLIVSNLCFQWFENPDNIFDTLKEIKPIFISSLADGSFGQWYDSIKRVKENFHIPINFVKKNDTSCIKKYDFLYTNGIDFLKKQRKIGTLSSKTVLSHAEIRKAIKIFQEQHQSCISYYLISKFYQ